MRSIARFQRTWVALPIVCALALGGCSADFAISFCAAESQSMSIDGFASSTSTRSAVSIAVGDSVRLVAHGFCQGQGLHIAIGTRGTHWHSRDESIVRLSSAPEIGDARSATIATVWAVGVAPGSTIVSGDLGEAGGSVLVEVLAR